jgi:tRNA uridine 5-carbamoylmethylation protein Kti12
VISGRPSVGKSTFASALKDYLESVHGANQAPGGVVLLNDESLGISKKEGYKSELQARVKAIPAAG